MSPFGGRARREPGARREKAARSAAATRTSHTGLGRETRGLVGPARRQVGGPGRGTGNLARGAAQRFRISNRLVTPARAAGLLGMLATGFLLTLVTGPTAFGLARTDVPPLTWTDPAAVQAALGLVEGTNLFRIDTGPLDAAVRALPGVAAADVTVGLPDAIVVHIDERRPVLAWQVNDAWFLADANGTVFARVDAATALPPGVAVIDDRRSGATAALAIGTQLDAIDADVATRLGSLSPTDIGSAASKLRIAITDADGFIVSTQNGWTAVFGFYSAATRPTDMIPGQVRLLRSLLAGREATISRIVLASETDGTYVPKATPRPSAR